MTERIADLTEKEKEPLRLLLAGHDAKSSGRELGISHHTVNDRLRSARRKLGVSTSKEAARLLGEAEGAIPQPLVHKPLGSAAAPSDPHIPDSANESPDIPRSDWRRKGLIIMSLALAAAVGAALLPNLLPIAADHPEPVEAERDAPEMGLEARIRDAQSLEEAQAFLALLDEGDAQASYDRTAGKLRANQGFQLWELGVALRKNRADFSTRKIVGAGGRDGEPEPGEAEREIFIFQSSDGDRNLTEFLVTERIDGEWMIIEYDLKGLNDDEE